MDTHALTHTIVSIIDHHQSSIYTKCIILIFAWACIYYTVSLKHIVNIRTGVVLVVSFFLIPVFFGSDFAKQFCGSQVDYYQKGQCTIDWSLYMGMVVSACSLYLPAIAVFALNISDGIKAPVCC